MRKKGLLAVILLFGACVMYAQEISVTGKVTDESDGLEIIGATVFIKGNPTSGTITGADGTYVIPASAEDTLVFSYVGYAPMEAAIRGRSVIDITIPEEIILIEEVDGEELKQTRIIQPPSRNGFTDELCPEEPEISGEPGTIITD